MPKLLTAYQSRVRASAHAIKIWLAQLRPSRMTWQTVTMQFSTSQLDQELVVAIQRSRLLLPVLVRDPPALCAL